MKAVVWYVILLMVVWEIRATEVLIEGVNFKPQSPPGDWQGNMNCGPTASLMLGSYYIGTEPTTNDLIKVLDWLYLEQIISPQSNAEYYDGNVTSISQLEKVLLQYFGVGQTIRQNKKDLEFIRKQVLKQNPVIVGVNINMNATQFGHFMVVVGLSETQVTVHDPGKTLGGYKKYSLAQFQASWATSNYATLVVRASGALWYPDGALVQPVGTSKVYVVSDNGLLWIKDEGVFNAMSFDWQKVIPVHRRLLDCLPEVGTVDWQPYREVWQISGQYFLFEKTSASASTCAIYPFVSKTALDSWQLKQSVQNLAAIPSYGQTCDQGTDLFLRNGVLVKATSGISGYGAGAIFVSTNNGELRPFASWDVFVMMGYENLPLMLLSESAIISAFKSFGNMITQNDALFCFTGLYEVQGAFDPDEIDSDGDGFSIAAGDCDDFNHAVSPFTEEVCDGLDNDCDDEEDEDLVFDCYTDCGLGTHFCESGQWSGCEGVEPVAEIEDNLDNDCDGSTDEGFEPTTPEDEELCSTNLDEQGMCSDENPEITGPSEINCRIRCPHFMVGFMWWGNSESLAGTTMDIHTTTDVLCERGEPWLDFNCACDLNWSCFAWEAALVECDVPVIVQDGIIDSQGEGEVWFPEIACY